MNQLQHAKKYILIPKEEYERSKISKRINPFANPQIHEAKKIRQELASSFNDDDFDYNDFLTQRLQLQKYLSNVDQAMKRKRIQPSEDRQSFQKDNKEQEEFLQSITNPKPQQLAPKLIPNAGAKDDQLDSTTSTQSYFIITFIRC